MLSVELLVVKRQKVAVTQMAEKQGLKDSVSK
jgi:hypothetical protein